MQNYKIYDNHTLKVLELENDYILLQIVPEIGAKILSILHKPDHGELWSQTWQWNSSGEEVHLRRHCICGPALVEKRLVYNKPGYGFPEKFYENALP